MDVHVSDAVYFLPLLTAVLGLLFFLFLAIELWWKPGKQWQVLENQGVHGPPAARLISGHLPEIMDLKAMATSADMGSITHDIASRIFPHVSLWTQRYGKNFLFMWGPEVRLAVTDPEILKDIFSPKCGSNWGKSPGMLSPLLDIVGKGLIWSEGEAWVEHRRIVSPAFHTENLKGVLKLMQKCADTLVNSWANGIEREGSKVMEVHREFIKYSADVISSTEFGTSFESSMKIFEGLRAVEKLVQKCMRYAWIPGHRYIPTRERLQIWILQKEIKKWIEDTVQARKEKANLKSNKDVFKYGDDMLGLMLAKAEQPSMGRTRYTLDYIVDEIKTFFIAAHETTALLLTWAMMLLALHPSWQERLREEVNLVCGSHHPSAEALGKLKLMTMVLKESLRLYTPVMTVARKSLTDMRLGHLYVPKNFGFFIPLAYIHHDKDLWGADADEFKPERFAEGGAWPCKHPMGFIPFSFGGRNCLGQSFAMMEAKVAFVSILKQFRFKLSPLYRHAPDGVVTLYPKHGVQVILEKL